MGRTKPFRIYLEGITEAVNVHPYVVRDLSHPLNLGQSFLRTHNADMSFRENGIRLNIKSSATMLEASEANLVRSSIDSRIKQVLDKFKENGNNPWSNNAEILDMRVNHLEENKEELAMPGIFYKENKKAVEFDDTFTRVHNQDKVLLKAGHTTTVTLKEIEQSMPAQTSNNDVMFYPKKTNKWLNKHQIFVHPGVYHRVGNAIKVQVSNFGSNDTYLPQHCYVGTISEAIHHTQPSINVLDHRPFEDLTPKEIAERREYIVKTLNIQDNQLLQKHPEAKEEVIRIFEQGFDAIAISEADYGRTNLVKFHIDIPKGTRPVRDRVRPLNPMQENDLRRQIDDWLEAKVIEPSCSPWASALVPCKKKGTEKYRWAIDYRKVNELTVKDAFPLANIECNLQKLAGTSIFSTLDSAGAFHTIPVHEEHRDYTAFNTPFGQYRFCRLPFGLANAPSAYSRLVQMALDRLPPGYAMGYIDDIIVHSNTLQDHLKHLEKIVNLHVDIGMKLNLRKCNIVQKEVEYLGHLVSPDGIRMIPSYVQRILDWPLPSTSKELKSFLGFTGYYRSFIPEYAHLTCEMNKIKNSSDISWTEITKDKFEQLKESFGRQPLRGYPQYDNSEPFILDTDYSNTNLAAILSQKQDGKEVFLGCVAKKCSKAEAVYPPHKGELGAVILGTKKFEHILRAKPFIIRTDSRCVQFMQSMKEYRGIWARWYNFLNSFTFTLVHRAGKKQVNADSLSRRPGIPSQEIIHDPVEPFSDIDDIYVVQPTPINDISENDLHQQYKQDPTFAKLLTFLEKNTKPSKEERKTFGDIGMNYINVFECLSLKDNIIYYQLPKVNDVMRKPRICLPPSLYNLAFKLCHADSTGTSGHYGMNNTFRKMKERFYFPHMYAIISTRINNCVPCITKKPTPLKKEYVQHRELLSYFNQRVYCDVIGPLNSCSYQGKRCRLILTIQDGFTRYLVAVPIPDQKTETVVTAIINNWIYTFGCMETLHTDRGTNFTSTLFQEVMQKLGIVKTTTPAYTPESDRVERSHRVLGNLLRADKRYPAANWTDKIKSALLAYNSTVNRMTGMSPFEAVFHRPVTLPVDIIFPLKKPGHQSWSNHIETMKQNLSQQCENICKIQQTTIHRENARYQGRAKQPVQLGDLCYYFLPRLDSSTARKLASRWIGPWKVQKIVSESLVIIYPAGNWSTNPKEVATTTNKIKVIDPQYLDLEVSKNLIDLNEINEELEFDEELLFYHENMHENDQLTTPTDTYTETEEPDEFADENLEEEEIEPVMDSTSSDPDIEISGNADRRESVQSNSDSVQSNSASLYEGPKRPSRISAETCKLRIALQNEKSKRKKGK